MAAPRAVALFGLTAIFVACLERPATAAGDQCVQWNDRVRAGASSGPVIGYSPNSTPFSFWDQERGAPAGFSVEICQRVAQRLTESGEVRQEPPVEVSSVDRFERLQSGEIDMLCSAVTHTLQRRREERMQFSITIFVTGAEIVFKHGSEIRGLNDLAGKRVGVLKNTTSEAGLQSALGNKGIQNVKIHLMDNHDEGFRSLRNDEIDAYVGDRALLRPHLPKYPDLRFSGRLYSFEPYAIAVRECDRDLLYEIDKEIAELFRSGQVWDLYRDYFPDQEPSHLLIATFILGGLPPG